MSKSKPTKTTKPTAPRKATRTAAPKVERTAAAAPAADTSKAIAASWTNKATAKARTTRHGCRVGNKEYPSVRAAFLDQGWPLGIHQRIRLVVKREGKAEVAGKTITLVKE